MKPKNVKRYSNFILITILLLGAVVRLTGIDYLLFPDESFQLYRALRIGRLEFTRNWFVGVYSYIMFVYYSVFFVIGLVGGWFSSFHDFFGQYLTNAHRFYLAGRTAESLAGIAGIYGIYILGSRMFNKRVGLIGAFFLSLNLTHVQLSQVARGQAFCSLFCIWALYFAYLVFQKGSPGHYIGAGLFIAAAASIRLYALGLFIPLVVSFICAGIKSRKISPSPGGKVIPKLLLCLMVFAVASMAFTVDIAVDFKWFLRQIAVPLKTISGSEEVSFLGCEVTNGWKVYLTNLLPRVFGWPLYICSLLAVGMAVYSWRKFENIFLTVFIIIYIAVMGKSSLANGRYMLPIFPAFILLAANFLDQASDKFYESPRARFVFISLISILLMIYPAISIIAHNSEQQKIRTQDVAKDWILQNIPDRARIAVESIGYSGPNIRLYSVIDYDIYRMSESELRRLYDERAKANSSGSLALKYFIDHPPRPWHCIYHLLAREKISIDDLIREKIKYVVTSSWVLRDYLTEECRIRYPDRVESRMEFYKWLERAGELIKVFKADENIPGPEIKVYKIKNFQ